MPRPETDAARALLEDVFTFLCYLHSEDTSPRGHRWLSSSALAYLNIHFRVRDAGKSVPLTDQRGTRGLTERQTERIRFVHFLCEAAGLVALTGRFLKPTLRAAHWLDASHQQRAAQLFAAAFPVAPDRGHGELWRAYRLPGHRLASPSHDLAPLLQILREAPRDERIRVTTLVKLVPLPAFDADDPDAQPEPTLRGVLGYLDWFDAIDWHGPSTVRLTDWGAVLLNRPDAPTPVLPDLDTLSALLVAGTTHLDLVAGLPTLYELSRYAELVAVKPVRRYRLDRARVQRALERGTTLDHILRFLESATGAPLPQPVAAALRRWADEFGRLTLRRAVLLEARDPRLLAELAGTRAVRESILRTLSPRAVIVRESRIPALMRHLTRRGLAPRLDPSLPHVHTSNHRFDDATLAHLLLAVRMCHLLSDRLPPAYRVPYSIVLDVEQRLSPRDRGLAADLAAEAAARLLETRARPTAADAPLPAPINREILAEIERAIAADAPLEIVYTDAHQRTTTRVVEPYRIEQRGKTEYLIAYCRLDQDERTFRLDRIQIMKNVE